MGDYFIGFDLIKYDIDNDVPEDKFIEYYDEMVEYHSLEMSRQELIKELTEAKLPPLPNYHHWLHGCPKPTPQEIERLKKAVQDAEELLTKEINRYNETK